MSSDRLQASLTTVLAAPTGDFAAALEATREQVRRALPVEVAAGGRTGDDAALGSFAQGRIDSTRFAALVARADAFDEQATGALERALATLTVLHDRGAALTRVRVPAGGSLRDAVGSALAEIGRAFASARAVELARTSRYDPPLHDPDLDGFPFERWTRKERCLVPPLLVEVDGRDCRAEGLSEFLDGTLRLVLVVDAPAPPAPLVRLVTPGVFVMQTADAEDTSRLLAWDGPGIAALVPEEAARFVHDPAAGRSARERLTVGHLPTSTARAALGTLSIAQLDEQLAQLRELVAIPVAAPAGAPVPDGAPSAVPGDGPPPTPAAPQPTATPSAPAASAPAASAAVPQPTATPPAPAPAGAGTQDAVDKLAAWLLEHADLTQLP